MINSALLIIIAIVVLSVIVIIHEVGHFLAAKKAGIWVEEFGIGIPPRVWGKKIGETIYSINALPIGGFVRLHGESVDNISKSKRAYFNKSPAKRIFVAVAGVFMNFVLAVFCFSVIYSFSGIPREMGNVNILTVDPSTPAEQAGLAEGDIIRSIDEQTVSSSDDFADLIRDKKGQQVTLEIEREIGGEVTSETVKITSREEYPEEEGPLGIIISSVDLYYPPIWQRPLWGIYYGIKETFFITKLVILGFVSIFVDLSAGQAPEGVLGPVGITALLARIAQLGILPLLNFIGLISVNLALLNLVPFPPFDGSRVVFIIAQTFFGKKVLPKVESILNTVGMILIILLLLVMTGREIPKLLNSGSLQGFVDEIIPLE